MSLVFGSMICRMTAEGQGEGVSLCRLHRKRKVVLAQRSLHGFQAKISEILGHTTSGHAGFNFLQPLCDGNSQKCALCLVRLILYLSLLCESNSLRGNGDFSTDVLVKILLDR